MTASLLDLTASITRTFSDTERCPQSDQESLTLLSDFLPGFPDLFFQSNTQRHDS